MVTLRTPLLLAALAAPALLLALPVVTDALGPLAPSPWAWVAGAVGLTGVLVLGDLALAGALRHVHCAREGDREIRAGTSGAVGLTVHNRGTRPVYARIRDAWVPSAGGQSTPDAATTVAIPPGGAQQVATRLTPLRRGDRPAVRVTIRSYGPLRLAYRQTTRKSSLRLTPSWTLRVLPEFRSRRFLPEKLSRLRTIDGQVEVRGRGQGTEFDSLREYVVGDDIRAIDWRATARAEHVVVKTWRPERDRRVLCVLDTGRTSATRVGDEPRLDAGIDAALLLAALAGHAGDRVDLLAADTEVRTSVSASSHQLLAPKLVAALATVEPSLSETDFELVTSEVLTRARQRSLVVLFTELSPAALSEGLLPVLPQLRAKHQVLVAAVRDPALDTLARGRASLPELFTAAAAEKALAVRDRVRAALTRYGVDVVEAPPATFPAAVADAYLDLKAAGRL